MSNIGQGVSQIKSVAAERGKWAPSLVNDENCARPLRETEAQDTTSWDSAEVPYLRSLHKGIACMPFVTTPCQGQSSKVHLVIQLGETKQQNIKNKIHPKIHTLPVALAAVPLAPFPPADENVG